MFSSSVAEVLASEENTRILGYSVLVGGPSLIAATIIAKIHISLLPIRAPLGVKHEVAAGHSGAQLAKAKEVEPFSVLDRMKHGNVAISVQSIAKYHHNCGNYEFVLGIYLAEYLARPMNTERYGKAMQAAQLINDGQIQNYTDLAILSLTVDSAPIGSSFAQVEGSFRNEVSKLLRRKNIPEQFVTGTALGLG